MDEIIQGGKAVSDVWRIPIISSSSKERIGYPTQKPLALLQRIVAASSSEGDVVLDPFCGCGTTIEAAETLGRKWIGIDITHHAIDVIEGRLKERAPRARYAVKGRPQNLDEARALAARNPYEFQWWANWLIGVQNYRECKKGPDKGIDGIIYFRNGPMGVGQVVISVKAGENIGPNMVQALAGTVQSQQAQLGVFISLKEPTAAMRAEAASSPIVRTAQGSFRMIQLVTVEQLLQGNAPTLPKPLETAAIHDSLRPRPQRPVDVDGQLSFKFPFAGGGAKSKTIQHHPSGEILAKTAMDLELAG